MGRLGLLIAWSFGAIVLAAPLVVGMPTPGTATFQHIGWGDSVQLSSAQASTVWSPAVAVDSYGNAIAVWTQSVNGDASSGGLWVSRFTPGTGWSEAGRLVTGGGSGAHVSMDASGVGVAVWDADGAIWASSFIPGWNAGVSATLGWSTPVSTSGGGHAELPQVAFLSSGRALVVWEENTQALCYSNAWANWFVPGSGWATPKQISVMTGDAVCPSSYGAHFPQLSTSPAGTAIVVWEQWDVGREASLWATSFVAEAGWQDPTPIEATGCQGGYDLASTSAGGGFAVWGGCTFDQSLYVVTFDPELGWGSPIKGPDGFAPSLAVSSTGEATVVWRCYGELTNSSCPAGVWTSQIDRAGSWSNPSLLEEGVDLVAADLWQAATQRVVLDPLGRSLFLWSQSNADGVQPSNATGNLTAREFVPGMGWKAAVQISPGYGFRTDLAVDPAGNVVVVWTLFEGRSTDGWRLSIWSNRFVSGLADSFPPTPLAPPQPEAADRWLAVGAFVLGGVALAVTLVSALRGHSRKDPPRPDGTALTASKPALWLRGSRKGRTHARSTATAAPSRGRDAGFAADWPKADGLLRLTAKERILLHLLEFARYGDAVEMPLELTQSGISRGAAIDLRHFAQYVRPMVKDGLVRERAAHVNGLVNKHKVYVLAEPGKRIAHGLRDRVRSAPIRVRDDSGWHDVSIGEVLTKRRGCPLLVIVRESIEADVVDLRS